jgi:protease secretion system outer membrane protein
MSVKIFKKSCLALVCAYAATSASALDLLQAYEAALTQDATYHAARLAADAGRENLPQARAQLMPSVSAAFSRNRNLLDTISPNSLGQLADSRANYPSNSNSVTLRQPIYRRYQWAQYQLAQAQVDDVNAVLDFSTQNLAVNVAGAYFDALLAGEQLALIATQLENYRTQLDAARKIFEAGSGTRTDIDEVQSRLDMSVAQELEARQNVDYTRQQLQVFVNQPVDSLSAVDVSKLELLTPVPTSAEAWVERAEQASPELRVLRARVEQSRFEVEKARAGHYPTLDAVAQWSRNGSENNQSINTTYESRRDLSVRVLKEFRGVTEGVLKVRAIEQAVRSSEQTLLSSQKSFQAGSRTRLDILNAQSNRMVVLRDLAQARYMYLMATLRLKALAGEADMAAVAAINANFQP